MDTYIRGILETAFKADSCNMVLVNCLSETELSVCPGELVGVDCNVGKQFCTDVMMGAMLSGKYANTETLETVVNDDAVMERNPDGEYRCYKRTNENVFVDTVMRLGVVYCKQTLVKPNFFSAVDQARTVFVSQRAVFRFGSTRLVVEFREGSSVYKVYGEINPAKATHKEIKQLLQVMMGKERAASF